MTAKKTVVPVPLYPHPLFLAEDDDDDCPRVELIKVTRWEAGGQRWVPQQFEPTALQSLEQIAAQWGGGNYELIAYGHRTSDGKAGAVGRRRYSLPGPSRALDGSGDAAPPPAAAAPAPAPMMGGGGASDWIPLLIAMMKSSADTQAAMFGGMMQTVSAMVTSSRDAASQQVAQMQALSQAHATQQAALLTAIVESKGGGGNTAGSALVEMLKEGIELGRAGGGDAGGEGDEFGSLMETAAPIIAGMMQAQQTQPHQAPPAAPSAPPSMPPEEGFRDE